VFLSFWVCVEDIINAKSGFLGLYINEIKRRTRNEKRERKRKRKG
jgi:hypothetical protein